MTRPGRPTPLAKLGLGIALAAFALILALGFSRQTVDLAAAGDSPAVACGSVFSPQDEPRCEDVRSDRETLMWAIGIPGVAIGLGIVVFGSRRGGVRK